MSESSDSESEMELLNPSVNSCTKLFLSECLPVWSKHIVLESARIASSDEAGVAMESVCWVSDGAGVVLESACLISDDAGVVSISPSEMGDGWSSEGEMSSFALLLGGALGLPSFLFLLLL